MQQPYLRLLNAISFTLIATLLIAGCSRPEQPNVKIRPEPIAEKRLHTLQLHGHKRVDPYYWLRDDARSDPDVLAYLKAENAYTRSMMSHTEALQESLYQEIAGRLVANDRTVPIKQGNYEYYREFRQGGEYPVYLRRLPGEKDGEVLLDVNELSEGNEYFQVGNWAVNYAEDKLAYLADNVSRRIYTLYIKEIETDRLLPDEITGVSTSIAWSADGQSLFYVRKDPETLLPYQVYRHVLGTLQSQDELIYEEHDRSFYTSVYNSRSKQFVIISSQNTDSSEIRLIPARVPTENPALVLAREAKHEYRIRHVDDTLYLITNWQAQNFRVMKVKDSQLDDKNLWEEVVSGREDTLITDIEVFEDYIVLEERFDGLPRIRVIERATGADHLLSFPDEAYTTWLHSNPELNTDKLRFGYGSLGRPNSIFEYDMADQKQTLLKQQAVRGDFDSNRYERKRIKVVVRDGTEVPVSIVYRKDIIERDKAPLYVNAYGAYGSSSEPEFSSRRLSLLDRGIVFALVHVRGGEEMGRHWYEGGKLLNKRNTFWDFIDATQALVEAGYGHKDKVIAMGGSAGGLLMGVIANEAPDLYLGIVAHVPFVDTLTTMLDESIPLTTGEFAEWGNPAEKPFYDYILSYSPYDQVTAKDYPHMFITTGLHDSQVQYFEPAKWVAKLRDQKTDEHRLLFDIDMTTGHGGASGRYQRYKTDALEYAFVLDILDIAE
ncbi:MAG: oligopeptidase B [Candidatus Azotimanducaceae bacterium]|jgi:oligopeptidase B